MKTSATPPRTRRSRGTVLATASAALAGALALGACAAPGASDPGDGDPAAVAQGIDDAGFRIFHAALEDGANTVVSPASIGLAFGLAYAGASGEVRAAIEELFALPEDQQTALAAFQAYEAAISTPPGTTVRPEGADDDVTLPTVTVANRVFVDRGFTVRDEYLDTVERHFRADAVEAPLSTDPEQAAAAINDWVSDRTEGLIEDLVDPGSLSSETRAMLVNAIYLLGEWETPFAEASTGDWPFTRLDGTQVDVQTMWRNGVEGDFAHGDDLIAAFLPYAGRSLEMVLIVPEEGAYAEVEERFGVGLLAQLDAVRESGAYRLGLPRFTAGSNVNLRSAIEGELGVTGLFGIEGLDGIGERLEIDDAAHATQVIVDEKGTEAAAATSIEVGVTSAPAEPSLEIVADRPFLYVIRDVDSGAALFVGRVLDPSA